MFGLLLFRDVPHFGIVILTIRFIIVLLRICVFQVISITIIFHVILCIFASEVDVVLQIANIILVGILFLIRIFNVALIDMLLLSLLHIVINYLNLRLSIVLLDFRRFLKILVARNLAILILIHLLLLFALVVNVHLVQVYYVSLNKILLFGFDFCFNIY
jgi:hypothetical protein